MISNYLPITDVDPDSLSVGSQKIELPEAEVSLARPHESAISPLPAMTSG